jgi:hypothetical protein
MSVTFYPTNLVIFEEYLYDNDRHFDDYNKIYKHTLVDTCPSTIYVFSILFSTFSEWLMQHSFNSDSIF